MSANFIALENQFCSHTTNDTLLAANIYVVQEQMNENIPVKLKSPMALDKKSSRGANIVVLPRTTILVVFGLLLTSNYPNISLLWS